MLTSSLVVVLSGARNVPIQEDWHLVAALTGHQSNFWQWVWRPNNEHRVPIPKLTYLGLLKLWPDFRVGMIFNMVVLSAIAAMFIIFLRRLRGGRTRWSDAFFPIAFLNLGNWENLGWSWQLEYVVATALACAALLLAAPAGAWTSRRAVALAACLIGIPLTGATALPFAPFIALGLLPQVRRLEGRVRTILLVAMVLPVTMTGLYFIGLPHPDWVPASPSPWASLLTGAKFLALSLGPAAGAWWFVSVLGVAAVVGGAIVILLKAQGAERWTWLGFMVAGVALAGELGRSRAGAVPYYGLPDRYALGALPALCAAYLVYERYGAMRWRRAAPDAICLAVIALLPINIADGLQYEAWYHQRVDTFAADLKAGVPIDQLAYDRPIAADATEMWLAMQHLQQAHIGVFSQLRYAPALPPATRRIDGLYLGASARWVTIGSSASRAAISPDGSHLVWSYDATPARPAALGRAFASPEDWRGQGAMVLAVSGQGAGRRVRVRLAVEQDGRVQDYDSMFVDSVAGPRTIVIPWNGFGHIDSRGAFDWQGPMPLNSVLSVTFVVADPGPGQLTIQHLDLQAGHPEFGWPFHPAALRHSLPPWR